MTRPERAVARILRADGGTAGLGFLVEGGRLVTCAHVVNSALGRERRASDRPEGTIRLRFAFSPADVGHTAKVTAWLPGETWAPEDDLAVLALTGTPPPGLTGLKPAASMPTSSVDVGLCGPDGDDRVKHVVGKLLGATRNGLWQIDQLRSGAHHTRAGFSGSPVWNESGEVLGVLRSARGEGGTDVDCLDVDRIREGMRPSKPEGVVDILQIAPLRLAESTAEQRIESLLAGISEDCAERSTTPDVIVFCGDLTANAAPAEYRLVRGLVDRLTARFGLGLDRVLTVPGRTDVNRTLCEAHFMQQAAMEEEPIPPYWNKWLPYSAFLSDLDGEALAKDEPWRLREIPELNLVLACLNSTMGYSHRPQDNEPRFGDPQLRWFFGRLSSPKYANWKRIVIAHDPPAPNGPEAHLGEFVKQLDLVLAARVEAELLHRARVLAPHGTHQLLRVSAEALDAPGWDLAELIHLPAQPDIPRLESGRDSFLDRVVTALEMEYPDARLRPVEHAPVPYVRVLDRFRSGDRLVPSDERLIGVEPREATVERIAEFGRLVDQFRVPGTRSVFPLVYFGPIPSAEADGYARSRQILLQSFAEFQFKWDPRHFTAWQLRELDADGLYPADMYIPQRFREFEHGDVLKGTTSVGLVDRVSDWFGEDQSHLIVVLGSAGTGKTFFMRMLARAMSASESSPTPVYLQLRDLERIPLLDELVARQFAKAKEHRLPVDRFNYYLREGRIALLLDGLDELTVQGGWDKAVRYLTEIREKVTGRAMIVVTARDEEFLSNREVERVLREGTGSIGRRAFKIIHFTGRQIHRFLIQKLGGVQAATERLELLRTFGPLPDVAKNPRMLSFLAEIDADRLVRARESGAKLGAAELYRQVIEQWKDREEERLRRDDRLPALDREQLWSAVSRLAVNLWRTGRERLTVEELGPAADLLSHIDADAQVHQISSGSLLIRHDDDRLGFIHRSVQEWFLAEAIANSPDIADSLAAQRLSDQTALFLAEMAPEIELRAPGKWSPIDPRIETFQGNAGLVSKHLPGRVSTPERAILDYTNAKLEAWNSSGVSIRGTSFRNAQAKFGDFTRQNLSGSNFTGADVHGADFSGAILRDAVLAADLTSAKLLGADLTGAHLTGAKLSFAALTDARVTDEQLASAETYGAALPRNRPGGQVRPFDAGTAIAANPQGTVLATGNRYGWVHLWSLPNLRPIRSWRALPGELRALEWSGDGSLILTGGDGPLCCWDPEGEQAWTMGDNHGDVRCMSWNRVDGRIACVSGDSRRLDVLDRDLEIARDPYKLHATTFVDLAWSPDGSALAVAPAFGESFLVGSDRRLTPHRFAETATEVRALAWAPDSTSVAVRLTDHAIVFDLGSMRVSGRYRPKRGGLTAIAWTRSGDTLLIGDDTGMVDGRPHSTGIQLEFSPSSILDTETGDIVAHGAQDTQTWRFGDADPTYSRGAQRNSIRSAAWSPDGGHIVSTDEHGRLRYWSARRGETRWTSHDATSRLLCDWAPDGSRVATVDLDGRCSIVPLDDEGRSTPVHRNELPLFAVRWSPGGGLIATGCEDGTVRVLKAAFPHERVGQGRLNRRIGDLLWIGEDGLVASDRRGLTRLTIGGGADWHADFACPPTALRRRQYDGRIVAALSDGHILALDPANGAVSHDWIAHSGPIRSLAGSSTRALLASGGDDGTVKLWRGDRLQREWTAHEGRVTALDYSPDGRHLLSAGDDGVLRIWEGVTGRAVATLVPLDGGGSAAYTDSAFKLDGELNGEFWYASGLVALAPLALARHTGLRRLDPGEPLWD